MRSCCWLLSHPGPEPGPLGLGLHGLAFLGLHGLPVAGPWGILDGRTTKGGFRVEGLSKEIKDPHFTACSAFA